MKNGFFDSLSGHKSSSRLIGFIVIMVVLVYVGLILYLGRDNVVSAASSAGLLFGTIAGPVMAFLFLQKKTEGNQEKDNEKEYE